MEVATLHALIEKGSRMTRFPFSDSSDSARFASNTNSTASFKLERVSSIVAPCELAPEVLR